MKIYVAGTFGDQKTLREQAHRLWDLGHEVTGTWLNEVAKPYGMGKKLFWKKLALKDVVEVSTADLLILDNRQSSGGKNCEWGVGIGQFQKKVLWLIGEPSNVFHELADRQFNDWDEAIEALKSTNVEL